MRHPAKPLPHTAPSHLSPHTSKACHILLGARLLLAWLVVGAAVMAAPATVRANQVYKACGKKWVRQAAKLEAEKVTWMMQARAAQMTRDLDGDGRADTLVMTNTPSFRSCDVKQRWDDKETTLRIEYATGKTQIFHWISPQLVEEMSLYAMQGRILVTGSDAAGTTVSRWVDYRGASREPSPARGATGPAALASIGPTAAPAVPAQSPAR